MTDVRRPSTSLSPNGAGRDSTLDFARALAVVGMVVGHCLHAVLTDEARGSGFTAIYWRTRAITGPLFLLLAGWVLVLAMRRVADRPLLSRAMMIRLGVLIAAGTILNWPCGDGAALLDGDKAAWTRLVAFGPLHCVAVSSVLALLVMTVVGSDFVRLVVFGVCAAVAAVATSWVTPSSGTFAELLAGGHSQYPLLPWAGFFFSGCCLPLLLPAAKQPFRRRLLFGAAVSLILFSGQIDPLQFHPAELSNFMLRLGAACGVVFLTQFTPDVIASAVAPLGRLSLWIYVIHLPIVYGFHEWTGLVGIVGRTLPTQSGAVVAVCVLLFSVAGAFVAQRLFAQLKAAVLRVQSRGEVTDSGQCAGSLQRSSGLS